MQNIQVFTENERSEVAQQTAEIFDVTASYVRLVIRDRNCEKYNSQKANSIRAAYAMLKNGRNNLLKAVEAAVKF